MGQIPEAICWSEGMQLLPQHFQQQSLRAEMLAAGLVAAAQPYFWGVLNIEIDEAALISGTLRVLELDAILPDGLWVSLRRGEFPALELHFQAAVAASAQRSATLYLLAPPLYRAGALDASGRRFISADAKDIPDLVSQASPALMSVWLPNVSLVDEQHRADGISLPLLRVKEAAGGFARAEYIAPQPRILPESPLGQRLAALCRDMREKCAFLSGRLRLAMQSGNEGDMAKLERQLAALWSRLPELQSLLDSRVAHPLALYQLLTGMAGQLCCLNPLAGVPAFRAFSYEEIWACFDELLSFLNTTVERIRAGYRRCLFEAQPWGFAIEPPLALQQSKHWVIGLQMPNTAAEDAARLWLERAVVASFSLLETLQKQRMRGILHRPLGRQEQASYSVGEDTRLFTLYEQGQWFKSEELLCIAVAGADPSQSPLSVMLFVNEASEDIPVLRGEL